MSPTEKALLIFTALGVSVGLTGSLLESVGKALGKPGLAAFGQRLEAISADFPKFFGKAGESK